MQENGCFILYKDPVKEKHERQLAADAKKMGVDVRIYDSKKIQALETTEDDYFMRHEQIKDILSGRSHKNNSQKKEKTASWFYHFN